MFSYTDENDLFRMFIYNKFIMRYEVRHVYSII